MATETPPRARKLESLHHLRGHWFVSTSALVGRIRFHVGMGVCRVLPIISAWALVRFHVGTGRPDMVSMQVKWP